MMLNKSKEPTGPPPSWPIPTTTIFASTLSTSSNAAVIKATKEPAGPPPALLTSTSSPQVTSSQQPQRPSVATFGDSTLSKNVGVETNDQNSWNTHTILKNDDQSSSVINQFNKSINSIIIEGGMLTRKRRRDSEQEDQEMNHDENAMMNEEEDSAAEEEEEEEEQFVYQPPQFASLVETDSKRLAQRQKQIDMGKNTIGYQNYTENVPRLMRQRFNKIHPVTPDIKELCSKRCFDGKIKAWRRQLHFWDILPGQSAANRVHVPNTMMRKRIRVEQPQLDVVIDESNGSSSSQKTSTSQSSEERSMFVDDLEL